MFVLTLALCKQLQEVNCDLVQAIINVDHVLDVVKEKRINSENTFNEIVTKSEDIAKSLDLEISVRRD